MPIELASQPISKVHGIFAEWTGSGGIWTIRLCTALRVGLPNGRHPDEAMRYLELNGLVKRPPALSPQTTRLSGTRTIQ